MKELTTKQAVWCYGCGDFMTSPNLFFGMWSLEEKHNEVLDSKRKPLYRSSIKKIKKKK